VLGWTLRLLRAIQFVMALVFAAYFVCVQINAVAYLVGRSKAIIGGVAPPVALSSGVAAAGDIAVGLVFEAFAAFFVFIALAVIRSGIRRRRAFAQPSRR
jgi:hypothetical protein